MQDTLWPHRKVKNNSNILAVNRGLDRAGLGLGYWEKYHYKSTEWAIADTISHWYPPHTSLSVHLSHRPPVAWEREDQFAKTEAALEDAESGVSEQLSPSMSSSSLSPRLNFPPRVSFTPCPGHRFPARSLSDANSGLSEEERWRGWCWRWIQYSMYF